VKKCGRNISHINGIINENEMRNIINMFETGRYNKFLYLYWERERQQK